jgi:hypothetical protein
VKQTIRLKVLFVPHYGNNKISTHEFNVVQLPPQINFHYENEIKATDLTCTNKDLTHPLPNPIHPANPPHLENPTIWSSSKLPNNIPLLHKIYQSTIARRPSTSIASTTKRMPS